jgi:hypothetical protein
MFGWVLEGDVTAVQGLKMDLHCHLGERDLIYLIYSRDHSPSIKGIIMYYERKLIV